MRWLSSFRIHAACFFLCGLLLAAPATAAEPLSEAAIDDMIKRVGQLLASGQVEQGAQRAREALEASLTAFGEDSPYTAVSLTLLGFALHNLNQNSEGEAAFLRALAIMRKINPGDHLGIAAILNGLANTLVDEGRAAEAVPHFREAVALKLKRLPPTDADVIRSEMGLGGALRKIDSPEESETVLRRAATDAETANPPNEGLLADVLEQLGLTLSAHDKPEDAERTYRRALSIRERVLPANDAKIGTMLASLAKLLWSQARSHEAEPLIRRAVAIHRLRSRPADRQFLAYALADLGLILQGNGDLEGAKAAQDEALRIFTELGDASSRDFVAISVALADTLMSQGKLDQAEQLDREALRIFEQTPNPLDHDLAGLLQRLALVLDKKGKGVEAVATYKQALDKYEAARLSDSLEAAVMLSNYAVATATLGNLEEGLDLIDRAMKIQAQPQNRPIISEMRWREGANLRIAVGDKLWARDGTAALDRVKAARVAAFADLQWARASGTGGAIAAASVRAQATDPTVAPLARERDALIDKVRRLDSRFMDISAADAITDRAAQLDAISAEVEAARTRLTAVDADIAARFPAFAELNGGAPVRIKDLMPLLAPDEVLVSIIPYNVTGFIFLIEHDNATSYRLPDARDADEQAARLRCSAARRLDPGCSADGQSGAEGSTRGADPLGPAEATGLFDLGLANQLYNELFPAEIRELVKGKKLIIVPAPELMTLPWNLLVTEPPASGWDKPGADRVALYRNAAWLFKSHPSITILPSLSSFRALRQAAVRPAVDSRSFLGVGDPVIGRSEEERNAPPPACGGTLQIADAALGDFVSRSAGVATDQAFTGTRDSAGFELADVERLRQLPRLAESRCELEAVVASLQPDGGKLLLGAEASEASIKSLDRSGDLAGYRTIQFATHGLVSGDLGYGEPGLVLTPPGEASSEDDGVLSASEIATLTLDADWVILSACNTAAGSQNGAEALTGLARAFFYAGARNLLVSSWPVYSQAAVDITTGAFRAMQANPAINRAEALTIAIGQQLDKATTEQTADPAYWAPFFLVGA